MDPNRLHLRPLCVTRYRYVYRLRLILRMTVSSNLDRSLPILSSSETRAAGGDFKTASQRPQHRLETRRGGVRRAEFVSRAGGVTDG
jgi:hypothetical protein